MANSCLNLALLIANTKCTGVEKYAASKIPENLFDIRHVCPAQDANVSFGGLLASGGVVGVNGFLYKQVENMDSVKGKTSSINT